MEPQPPERVELGPDIIEAIGPAPAIVPMACDALGSKLVAYIAGVGDTATVRAWAEGDETPPSEAVAKLAAAYEAAALLSQRESAAVIQVWFQGRNPELSDVAPARLLREGDLDEVGPQVLAAARMMVVSS